MNQTGSLYSSYHVPFYVLYIVVGIISILFHVRFIMIVQWNSSLSKLPAYRILKHGSVACTINILSQITAEVCTFSCDNMNFTANSIIGAIFQGSWAVEYPMILILAVNRLVAVLLPYSMDRICSMTTASRGNSARSLKAELPILLHFGTIFALTAVVLMLWHHPVGTGDLYGHVFNLFVLLRFAPSPILALLTNPTIRRQFFHKRINNKSTTTIPLSTAFSAR
ncbi:unnamed protein product [Heligmosomoides polygyrus]|uniref:G protein-coupled receptor n=1 Tax=Heligmosomoides polygyrus TaxID=6339 RepID=A0A183GA39_HELPZ|nr:unnamed protein product [Heligmosomoides polygyrus]